MLGTTLASELLQQLLSTSRDVVPILLILLGFQFLVVRRRVAHPGACWPVSAGFCWGCPCFCLAWKRRSSPWAG